VAGDPNLIADIFDVQVQFIPATATGRFGFANPTCVSEFAANPSFPGRIKAYTGTQTQKLAALAADGFTTASDAYRQVKSMNLQDGPARTIYVGRKDAGDADWGEAIEAIKTAADLTTSISFYAFVAATRDPLEIEAIADYLEGVPDEEVFGFYLGQTAAASVLNNTAGNVALNILAKDYKRTALLWHDPETASGYGPAILQSAVGPFNISDGATIEFRIDGGATQSFSFAVTAATLLGSNPETFSIADGDELIFALDNGADQTITFETAAATLLCASAETYDFTNGMTLAVRVDGAGAQTVIFNGTAGDVATTTGAPWALADLETVTFAIDGGANQVVTFNTADFVSIAAATAAELLLVYQAQLTGVTVVSDGTDVTVTSNRLGTSSDVEIVAGTGGALAALGYVVGNNAGTGFAAFLDVATAAEVATEINADTINCVAAAESGQVRITSNTVGTNSRLQITGGTANALLNFDTNETSGSGDFADASAVTALEVVTKINAEVPGGVATVDTGAVRLTSTISGTGSVVDVAASTVATTLGLSLVAVVGTGDFFNAAQATAGEIALLISATIVDGTASSAESRVKITSGTSGGLSTVQAIGGTLLTTLFFVDATAGTTNSAVGTGVLEDFADAAWMGRCITFNLDGPNGAALWDNQTLKGPSPTGAGTIPLAGDRTITKDQREVLHNTLFVNTYELRNGRNETHFGTLLNSGLGAGSFIDVRTTIDWFQARISEAFKRIDDANADAKTKLPYLQPGIDVYALGLTGVLQTGAANGHTVFDDSALDLDNPQDTGVFIPTVVMQTQVAINTRLIDGFRAQQLIQGGIQRGRVILNLIGPTAQ
jgi:hypothetical protein